MNEEIMVVGMFEANCLILYDTTNTALVIDPGADANSIIRFIEDKSLEITAYLLTHGHMDHVSALASVHQIYPATVYMHEKDAAWAFTESNQLPPYYSRPDVPDTEIKALENKQVLSFGELTCRVLYTPGHSPGSVCFYFEQEKLCITGDTLFKESVGRTDLPGGNSMQLKKSLEFLQTLPNDTRIIPGHGPESTIGHEKTNNFFMRGEMI